MSILSFIYDLIIGPIIMLFDTIFSLFYTATIRVGASIIALSIVVNLLVLPLYRRADAMQEEERVRLEKLKPGIDHIKKVFKGDERFMMLQTYYRQNHYKPYYSLKGSLSLLLEIPFFIAAYNFLSHLYLLNGTLLMRTRQAENAGLSARESFARCLETDQALDDLSLAELQSFHPAFEPDVYEAMSLKACVERRRIPGGPAPETVQSAIEAMRRTINL